MRSFQGTFEIRKNHLSVLFQFNELVVRHN